MTWRDQVILWPQPVFDQYAERVAIAAEQGMPVSIAERLAYQECRAHNLLLN